MPPRLSALGRGAPLVVRIALRYLNDVDAARVRSLVPRLQAFASLARIEHFGDAGGIDPQ
jgi:hypothetical protein